VKRDGTTVETYTYDSNGNRTSRKSGTMVVPETASYDAQDRLTALGTVAYSYNADGFLTARGADTFSYGTTGELRSATSGGQTSSYAYDAAGRLVARTSGGQTHQYLYGNQDEPYQVTAAREPSGALSVYDYDDEGALFAIRRQGVRYYVASDQVGTPRVVTNSAGAVIKNTEYDSFGNLLSDSNPGFFLAVGFAGGIPDPTTRLVRFGLRDYDPKQGRWTARDPIFYAGGQANLYAYVANDPVNGRDPSGLTIFRVEAAQMVRRDAKPKKAEPIRRSPQRLTRAQEAEFMAVIRKAMRDRALCPPPKASPPSNGPKPSSPQPDAEAEPELTDADRAAGRKAHEQWRRDREEAARNQPKPVTSEGWRNSFSALFGP